MEDSLGRLIAGILSVLVMVYLPVMSIAQKQENTKQSFIDNAVVEFVDNARATGKITDDGYEELCSQIDTVEGGCRIELYHKERYEVMNPDGEIETYYAVNTKPEILDDIYTAIGNNKPYYMSHGDFLQVTVYNESPTIATRIVRLLLPRFMEHNTTLYTNYSGYVGNIAER